MRALAFIVAFIVALPSVAAAEQVSWMFTGYVDGILSLVPIPELTAKFPLGTPVSFWMTYETQSTTPMDLDPSPNVGRYEFIVAPDRLEELDVEARLGGVAYYLTNRVPSPGTNFVGVAAQPATLSLDNFLTERLAGDTVGRTRVWKPHAMGFYVSWDGFSFASDTLPTAIPHANPVGAFQVHLWVCSNVGLDQCDAPSRAAVTGTLMTAHPVVARRIDVNPRSAANRIDFKRPGTTPVALLGSQDFLPDVVVDRTTIQVSGAPVKIDARTGVPACAARDVNEDGYLDLVCQFQNYDFELQAGPRTARLIARTLDGSYIRGTDSVVVIR